MAVRLEHANLTVRDVEETIRFLQTAFPEFRVRGEGKGQVWRVVATETRRSVFASALAPTHP